jgi:hypothetical protein
MRKLYLESMQPNACSHFGSGHFPSPGRVAGGDRCSPKNGRRDSVVMTSASGHNRPPTLPRTDYRGRLPKAIQD